MTKMNENTPSTNNTTRKRRSIRWSLVSVKTEENSVFDEATDDEYSRKANMEMEKWNKIIKVYEQELSQINNCSNKTTAPILPQSTDKDERIKEITSDISEYLQNAENFTYAYDDYMKLLKRQNEINELHYKAAMKEIDHYFNSNI